MASLIELENCAVELDGIPILRQISCCIAQGEYVAIAGPNGAGKTTMLRTMLGLISPAKGEVKIGGQNVKQLSKRELAKLIAYVPQSVELGFPLTVSEFMQTSRFAHVGLWEPLKLRDEEAILRAMDLTRTRSFLGRTLQSLSAGERQRVFMAGALAQEAKALLLDEAHSFLDPQHEAELAALLRAVNRESQTTVVMVSHDLNRISRECSRIVGLKAGQIIFDGLAAAFMQADVLHALYGAPASLFPHPISGAMQVIFE